MSQRRLLTIVLAGVAVLLLVWRFADQLPRSRSTPDSDASADSGDRRAPASRSAGQASASPATSGPSSGESKEDRPVDEAIPEIEQQARQGDARAARLLGFALAHCNRFVPVADRDLEEMVIALAASGYTLNRHHRELSPDESLLELKLGLQQKSKDCRTLSGLNEDDAQTKAFQWIERAAALGDADAQAMYAELAFAGYDARSALMNAEEIRDRKQRALAYLQSAQARGDALALKAMYTLYSDGMLAAANGEDAYAYLYAYSLTPRAQDLVPANLENMLAEAARGLDAQSLERARQSGQQLAGCCLLAVGDGP